MKPLIYFILTFFSLNSYWKTQAKSYPIKTYLDAKVSIPPLYPPTLTASKLIVCGLGYPTTLTVTGCSGTVNWFAENPNTQWSGGAPSGNTATAYIYKLNKFYVTCTVDGITSESSDTLDIDFARVAIDYEAEPENFICTGGRVQLEAQAFPDTGIVSYRWKRNSSTITDSINASINVETPGKYIVDVTYSDGCQIYTSNTSAVTLIDAGVISQPNIVIVDGALSGPAVKIFDKRFGSNSTQIGIDIIKDNSGNFILAGEALGSSGGGDQSEQSKGPLDYWVLKVDKLGNKIWDKIIGGSGYERISKVISSSDNDFMLFGTSNSDISGSRSVANTSGSNSPSNDMWVVKIDTNGTKKWDKKYGGTGSDEVKDVLTLPNNEFIIAGNSSSDISGEVTIPLIGSYDYWMVKIDSAGNKIWDRRYGGTGEDKLYKILKAQNGDFLLIGASSSNIGGDKTQAPIGYDDIWIIRTDANGNKIWDKTIGSPGYDAHANAQLDGNDNLILSFIDNSENLYFFKVDSSGNTIWQKQYSGVAVIGKIILNDNGFLHIGSVLFADVNNTLFDAELRGLSDAYIVQFDSSGNKIWDKLMGGSSKDGFYGFHKENDVITLLGGSRSPVSFEKSQIPRGTTEDYWMVQIALKQEITSPYAVDSAQAIHLFANNCPGQIEWSGGASGYSSAITVHPTTQTTYTAKCRAYGCSTTSSIQVELNCSSNFEIVAIENSNVIEQPTSCNENSTFDLEARGCSGTVTWFNGSVGNNLVVSVLTDSTFKATCSNTQCSSVSDSISILLLKKPTLAIDGPATFCIGGSTNLYITNPETGVSYDCYKDDQLYLLNQPSILSVNESGSFKAKITKGNCSAYSDAIQVTVVTDIPNSPTFDSDKVYTCLGSPITLSSLGCESGLTKWSNDSLGTTITTAIINSPASFTATCTLNTCTSEESSPISVKLAEISIIENQANITCNDKDITLHTIREPISGTYQWYRNTSSIADENKDSLLSNIEGAYYIKMTLSNGCAVNSNTVNIQENIVLAPQILSAIEKGLPKDTLLQLWDKSYGGTSSDLLHKIIKTQDNNFLLVGTSYSSQNGNKTTQSQGQSDVYLVKIDSLGNKIWDKSFGTSLYDEGTSATTTSDGNVLIVGLTYTANDGDKTDPALGGTDIWLIKIDQNGNKIWDKVYGSEKHESLGGIFQTTDNNYLIHGWKRALNFSSSEGYLIKINIDGDVIWTKAFTGGASDEINSAINAQGGGYIFAGRSTSGQNLDKSDPSYGTSDLWVIKTDVNGNKLWDKSYGGTSGDLNSGIIQLSDGSLIISGTSYSSASGNKTSSNNGLGDYWILKTDASGNIIWDKSYGGLKNETLTGLFIRSNERIIITGNTTLGNSFDISEASYGPQNTNGSEDGWVIEMDSQTGDIVWDKLFGGTWTDRIKGYIELNHNSYLVGDSYSGQNGSKTYLPYGDSDYWLVNIKRTDTVSYQSSIILTPGQSVNLFASNCQGDISWSNGSEQASILVSPAVTTTYTAECTAFGCTTASSIKVNVYTCEEYISLTISDNIMTGTSISPINKNAYGKIEATNQIGDIGTDASAKYTSGGSIELNNGFKVEAGSIFKAEISSSPCDN